MSDPTPSGRYADEANTLDEQLDQEQAAIRRAVETGEISLAEAAHQRIAVMEAHLAAIRALRIRHFGGSQS